MKKSLLPLMLLASTSVLADDIDVTSFRYAGPYTVQQPVMMDSLDVNSKAFERSRLLDTPINMNSVEAGAVVSNPVLKSESPALHLLGFTLSNTTFASADISVKGADSYAVFVDGKQITGGHASLQPSVHKVVIKCMTDAGKADSVKVSVDGEKVTIGEIGGKSKRTFTIQDVMTALTFSGASISADGKWVLTSTYKMNTGGAEQRKTYLQNLATGAKQTALGTRWMPRTNKYLVSRKNDGAGYTLVAIDPATQAETILAETLPESSFTMSPTEDFVIYSKTDEGPKEKKDVYEVITPDDRQPGWRNRSNLYKYDLKTGMVTQLTYGHHNVYLYDISEDGKKLLICKSEYDAAAMRPTDFMSMYVLDLATMQLDKVFTRDGFTSSASFSPDGKSIVVKGSPEAFGGIGLNISEGQTASMFDYQLFLVDLQKAHKTADGKGGECYYAITPLTKDFNPSVGNVQWSRQDGQIYFSAEDKDCVKFFRLNPSTKKIQKIATPEDVMDRFDLASTAGNVVWYGESAVNGHRLYSLNTKTLKNTLVEDISKDQIADIDLGECHPYTWVNPQGDSICCTYYLPPHFDASKQYPMIVNYYGGCSPTSRTFGGRYAKHAYSALGYVVLVINPRGATGFGQKWSAAHVNTAGQGVAEDIIGTVKAFAAEKQYVNAKKIGCIGASYGGFMTQYLQTQTDIFAAAVSHAGISDHTSYWGEGYWGYSYSQTSMANSYPWTRKDLYVDQSPLFNADKIHTPLLFVHGAADTNVPVGESIQMYTALKLLGRPTAMVLVEGENHWIMEYNKRVKWQNTIWAWFAKYLQDDDSWWKEMYSDKTL